MSIADALVALRIGLPKSEVVSCKGGWENALFWRDKMRRQFMGETAENAALGCCRVLPSKPWMYLIAFAGFDS